MKIVRNDKLIKRNKIIGNVASFGGIAILIFGLVMSFDQNPVKTLIAFIALIVGFVVAQLSTYFVTRFSREPRFDEVIATNLSKLSDDYTFYVYSTPLPMVLVGPAAIWIPVTTMAGGEIYYDKKWKQRGGRLMLKIFGQENIGKPSMDIDSSIATLAKTLSKSLPENDILPIKGILVAMHPDVKIGDVEEAPNLIVTPDALRRTIRKYDRKDENSTQPALLINANRALNKEEEEE